MREKSYIFYLLFTNCFSVNSHKRERGEIRENTVREKWYKTKDTIWFDSSIKCTQHKKRFGSIRLFKSFFVVRNNHFFVYIKHLLSDKWQNFGLTFNFGQETVRKLNAKTIHAKRGVLNSVVNFTVSFLFSNQNYCCLIKIKIAFHIRKGKSFL